MKKKHKLRITFSPEFYFVLLRDNSKGENLIRSLLIQYQNFWNYPDDCKYFDNLNLIEDDETIDVTWEISGITKFRHLQNIMMSLLKLDPKVILEIPIDK